MHRNGADGFDKLEFNELIGKKLTGPGISTVGRSGTGKSDELCLHISGDLGFGSRTRFIEKGTVQSVHGELLANPPDSINADNDRFGNFGIFPPVALTAV